MNKGMMLHAMHLHGMHMTVIDKDGGVIYFFDRTVTNSIDEILVLLADEHATMRGGLKAVLGPAKDIVVIGEARNGREAVDAKVRLNPDVVVMDLSMDVLDGASATRELKKLSICKPRRRAHSRRNSNVAKRIMAIANNTIHSPNASATSCALSRRVTARRRLARSSISARKRLIRTSSEWGKRSG